MGNSHSQGAALEPAELDKLSRSIVQLQKDDDEIPMPKNAYTPEQRNQQIYTPQQRRQQIRSQLLGSYEELKEASATPPANSKLSLNTDVTRSQSSLPSTSGESSRSELDQALAVIDHLQRTASPDQLAVLHQAVMSVTSQESKPNTPIDRAPMSPIAEEESSTRRMTRRRSLFSTPGTATREKSPKLVKRPAFPGKKVKTQTWSPEMFATSPLSKIAGWESKNNGQAEVARSATPDFNGSYLGTHKIGSLHITNGAVSPEPSIYELRPHAMESATSHKPEQYYTASEGSGRTSPEKSFRSDHDMVTRHKPYSTGDVETSQEVPEVTIQTADADDSFTSADEAAFATDTTRSVDEQPARPLTAMGMYMTEASSNPYLPEQTEQADYFAEDETAARPVRGHAISTGTERDSGFHDMDDRCPRQSSEPNDDRSHANHGHPKTAHQATISRTLQDNARLRPGILSTTSSVYSTTQRCGPVEDTTREPQGRPKTDSGYTSQDSISTVEGTGSSKDSETPSQTTHSDTDDVDNIAQHSRRQAQPASLTGEQIPTPRARPPIPRTTNLMSPAANSESMTPEKSKRAITSAETTKASDTNASPLEKPSLPPKVAPKKLQKRRPISERYNSAPLVVQTAASDSTDFSTLPTIPSDVVSRYSHRLSKNPDMEHLERTYKSVSHSNSKESLLSMIKEPLTITFPSPSRSPEPATSENRGRGSTQPREEKRRFSWSRSKSRRRRSSDRSSSRRRSGEEVPISVADFGTVAASLGSSPYDFAMASNRPPRQGNEFLPEAKKMMHPHQLGAAPRKRVGMNDEQASNFALQRSRDRLENMDPRDVQRMERHRRLVHRSRSNGTGSQRPRPHSYHAPTEMERDLPYLSHAENGEIDDGETPLIDPRGRIQSFEGLTAHYTFETSPGRDEIQADVQPNQDSQAHGGSPDPMTDYFPNTVKEETDQRDHPTNQKTASPSLSSSQHVGPDTDHSTHAEDREMDADAAGSRDPEQSASPVIEHPSDWETSASMWRQRRQSIGKGLGPTQGQEDPGPPARKPVSQTPSSRTTRLRQASEDQHPLHLDTSVKHTERPKVASSGSSVLQRAAAYERVVDEQRAASPVSRSASPVRTSDKRSSPVKVGSIWRQSNIFTESPSSIYGEVKAGRWNGRLDGS